MFNSNSKFLVVDDFKTIRTIVKKSLVNMGYNKLVEAEDGAVAHAALLQAAAEGEPFHCVICDWNMPNLSGFEFLQKVRADAAFKNLPFILLTAENEQQQVIEAIKAGVSSYMVKPFTADGLKAKLALVYSKHFPAAAA